MNFVGENGIICLDDDDYAAYAMYMQCLGEQVEGFLAADISAASASLSRPMAVWRDTQNISQGGGSSTGGSSTLLYSYNWAPTFNANITATLNRQGWWLIGALSLAVSNTPVVNNHRILSMNIYNATTTSGFYNFTDGTPIAQAAMQDIIWETNTTNGESLHIAVDQYCSPNPNAGPNDQGLQIVTGLQVENSGAETVTFTTTIWAIFLGDTPLIGA